MNAFKKVCLIFIIASLIHFFNVIASAQIEWAKSVVKSTMIRQSPSDLGRWSYPHGFYLFGQYRIWKLIGDVRYFQYIQDWVDLHVDSQGNIDQSINSLDNSEPGLITLLCYLETGEEKYKLAADNIRAVFQTYPRTTDGGFWHNTNREGQLWLDGVYMDLPFLVHYAQAFVDTTLFTEAANQIIIYASHLTDTTGLLFHAYDEDGSENWADPVTHHSPYFWGRSMGWFGMAIVEILEIIPQDHPKRSKLIQILANLIEGLSKYQDSETGLWYQVVDKGDRLDNWLETSCSCMYSYFTAKAVEKGYVDSSYQAMAVNAYEGVLKEKFSINADSLTYLKDISQGTGVSADYNYYINRSRNTNDLHGLGAFLMMCWQMAKTDVSNHENRPPIVQIKSPLDSSYFSSDSVIKIIVNAYDSDGQVTQVDFYQNNHLLGTDSQSPWEYVWNHVPAGMYILTAVAHDDSNATTVSDSIHVFVSEYAMYIEAETGIISSGSVDNNHEGYTGDGFVNFTNEQGTYLDLMVSIPRSGVWDINFRYANGSSHNRPCEIRLNDCVVDSSLDFFVTGAWDNWVYTDELSLNLAVGNNVFRITGLSSESGPNLDHLRMLLSNSTQVSGDSNNETIRTLWLFPNYPNPFNPFTSITYRLPESGYVKLSIYNMQGQLVDVLIDEEQVAGSYSHHWNPGELNLGSGLYCIQLQFDDQVQTRKILFVK